MSLGERFQLQAVLDSMVLFPKVPVSALEAFEKASECDNPGNIKGLLATIAAAISMPARSAAGNFVMAIDHCFPIRCDVLAVYDCCKDFA